MTWIVTLKGAAGFTVDHTVRAADEWEARQAALKAHAADPEHVPAWCTDVRWTP